MRPQAGLCIFKSKGLLLISSYKYFHRRGTFKDITGRRNIHTPSSWWFQVNNPVFVQMDWLWWPHEYTPAKKDDSKNEHNVDKSVPHWDGVMICLSLTVFLKTSDGITSPGSGPSDGPLNLNLPYVGTKCTWFSQLKSQLKEATESQQWVP